MTPFSGLDAEEASVTTHVATVRPCRSTRDIPILVAPPVLGRTPGGSIVGVECRCRTLINETKKQRKRQTLRCASGTCLRARTVFLFSIFPHGEMLPMAFSSNTYHRQRKIRCNKSADEIKVKRLFHWRRRLAEQDTLSGGGGRAPTITCVTDFSRARFFVDGRANEQIL